MRGRAGEGRQEDKPMGGATDWESNPCEDVRWLPAMSEHLPRENISTPSLPAGLGGGIVNGPPIGYRNNLMPPLTTVPSSGAHTSRNDGRSTGGSTTAWYRSCRM